MYQTLTYQADDDVTDDSRQNAKCKQNYATYSKPFCNNKHPTNIGEEKVEVLTTG